MIDYLVELFSTAINMPFVRDLAYPFSYVITKLSNIRIDLSSVQVTCAGSQAPIFLFLDLIFMGLIVIIIESDLQIFWAASFKNLLQQATNLIYSRYFLSKNVADTLKYAALSAGFTFLPDPRKLIQYVIGYLYLYDIKDVQNLLPIVIVHYLFRWIVFWLI